jgi:hypothetical protein
MKKCHFCGCEESAHHYLSEEGYYDDIFLCHECWFSEAAKQWRKQREADDPGYRRHMEIITAHFEIACPACNTGTYRYPKFIGHSPSWEMCCTQCELVDYKGPAPYGHDLTAWHRAYDAFAKGRYDIQAHWAELVQMERALDLPVRKCGCGGEYSMLAMPRCRNCGNVVYESIFHFCDADD